MALLGFVMSGVHLSKQPGGQQREGRGGRPQQEDKGARKCWTLRTHYPQSGVERMRHARCSQVSGVAGAESHKFSLQSQDIAMPTLVTFAMQVSLSLVSLFTTQASPLLAATCGNQIRHSQPSFRLPIDLMNCSLALARAWPIVSSVMGTAPPSTPLMSTRLAMAWGSSSRIMP